MADWNFNMDEAPRGASVTETYTVKGFPRSREVQRVDKIIVASECGKVTSSHWIAAEGRWQMFNADSPPIAWQPWPTHPRAKAEGRT